MLEFLFENPLLIIIILALISSAFKKGVSGEEKRKTARPSGPFPENPLPVEPEPMMFPKFEPEPQMPVFEEPPAEKSFREKRKQIEEKLAALKEQEAALAEKAERIHNFAEIETQWQHMKKEKAAKREAEFPLELDKPGLVNGIILSEVLGPPRAKRPHRSLDRR